MPSKRPSRRSSSNWKSSIVGTHASGASGLGRGGRSSRGGYGSRSSYTGRSTRSTRSTGRSSRGAYSSGRSMPSSRSLHGRTAEIHQVRPSATPVAQRRGHHSDESRVESFMRRRRIVSLATVLIAVMVIVFAATNLGQCAYRASVGGNMALNDSDVESALTEPADTSAVEYILVAGMNDWGTSTESASYLGILRVNPAGGRMTLMNVPSNISYATDDDAYAMLRDIVRLKGEAALIDAVEDVTGLELNHYVRIDEEGFVKLVDDLGGIEVDVQQRVDDPTVSSVVIDKGQQTLSGEQALAYVSAYNYASVSDGRSQRSSNQGEVLSGLIAAMSAKSGMDFMSAADSLSQCVKTDMTYEELDALAQAYSLADEFTCAMMPGSANVSSNLTYFSVSSSKWSTMKDLFTNGEVPQITVDTSDVDKSDVTITVKNGTSTAGLAAQAAEILANDGWTVDEPSNADSFVYDETLVIYADDEDKATAQAVVDSLGCGRAVSAGIYYSLSTDIQVVVGKDWAPSS